MPVFEGFNEDLIANIEHYQEFFDSPKPET